MIVYPCSDAVSCSRGIFSLEQVLEKSVGDGNVVDPIQWLNLSPPAGTGHRSFCLVLVGERWEWHEDMT